MKSPWRIRTHEGCAYLYPQGPPTHRITVDGKPADAYFIRLFTEGEGKGHHSGTGFFWIAGTDTVLPAKGVAVSEYLHGKTTASGSDGNRQVPPA